MRIPPATRTEAASTWLAAHARGDPSRAERAAVAAAERALGRRWPTDARRRAAWVAWAPLIARMHGLDAWPDRARAAFAAVLDAKADDEFVFQRRLVRHPRLRAALGAIARGADADPV